MINKQLNNKIIKNKNIYNHMYMYKIKKRQIIIMMLIIKNNNKIYQINMMKHIHNRMKSLKLWKIISK